MRRQPTDRVFRFGHGFLGEECLTATANPRIYAELAPRHKVGVTPV
jgi:hypothetical protein